MRKNIFWYILTCTLIATACQKRTDLTPNSELSCTINYENHPKNSPYQELMDRFTQDGLVGITLLVDNPKDGLWLGASGYAAIENKIKMTPCHLNYAASLNKTYLATMILQLEEDGKLSLDDLINFHLPDDILNKIPNGHKATIRQLLQCRSGMPDLFEVDFILDLLNNPIQAYTIKQLLEQYAYKVAPIANPDEKFYYGDLNFVLLALIIEKFDGDLADAYQKRIFQPLQLQKSYLINHPKELPNGIATSYWDRYGNGIIENVSDYQIAKVAGLEGSDGLIANTTDLNLFMRGLVNGNLIGATSFAKMMDCIPILKENQTNLYQAYGLGIAKIQLSDEIWYGSLGNHIGSGAIMLYNPKHNTTIIALQNKGTFFNDATKEAFFGYFFGELEQIALF